MYKNVYKCIDKSPSLSKIFTTFRYLSSTEISTALRPFYFSVHPDLFGQYPNQRVINENSLKQLSSFIETAQSRRPIAPCILQFYLRENKNAGKFKIVNIQLRDRNLRNTIHVILKSCNLSTEYLDNLESTPDPVQPKPYWVPQYRADTEEHQQDYDISSSVKVKRKVEAVKGTQTLRKWLQDNHKKARDVYKANAPMRDDLERLSKDVCKTFEIAEVRWDCGWDKSHFRGCLQSFLALAKNHPAAMYTLKGRTLVFAAFTGLSLDGHIMLNSGEVRHNWLDLIKNVNKHDIVLLRIPAFERAVSQVLRDMKVVRRKFMPKILAEEYEKHLCRLMTSLNDFKGSRGFPNSWPSTLSNHEIVVETEAGPLMVSPTGQFIAPSSCPGGLLVSFISDNLEEAEKKATEYKAHKHIEKSLHSQCIENFNLVALGKDDNVTPEVMIKCCERLLEFKPELILFDGLNLNITTYYSVLSDGTFCIPWNWKI